MGEYEIRLNTAIHQVISGDPGGVRDKLDSLNTLMIEDLMRKRLAPAQLGNESGNRKGTAERTG